MVAYFCIFGGSSVDTSLLHDGDGDGDGDGEGDRDEMAGLTWWRSKEGSQW
jgi:hypothetical protein